VAAGVAPVLAQLAAVFMQFAAILAALVAGLGLGGQGRKGGARRDGGVQQVLHRNSSRGLQGVATAKQALRGLNLH
jgi:hypothetical protein